MALCGTGKDRSLGCRGAAETQQFRDSDIGRIVGLIFIPFAAWFYGMQIHPASYPQLIGVGFVGAFAKPVISVPLLLNLAEIPTDIFNLYLAVGVLASRFADLMKASHLLAFSILATCYLTGAIRFNLRQLLRGSLVTIVLLLSIVGSIQWYLRYPFEELFSKENRVQARQLQGVAVAATISAESTTNQEPLTSSEDRLDRIRRQGVLRIGFDHERLPFSYYNRDGALVGFDIDMAHQLARDLEVEIEFVPFTTDVTHCLREDQFDVAMSGLEGTLENALETPHIQRYLEVTVALVVPDHRRREFRSLKLLRRILDRDQLRVAVVKGRHSAEFSADFVFDAAHTDDEFMIDTVELSSEREFFESEPPLADVLITSAEAGSPWPQYSVVKPSDLEFVCLSITWLPRSHAWKSFSTVGWI